MDASELAAVRPYVTDAIRDIDALLADIRDHQQAMSELADVYRYMETTRKLPASVARELAGNKCRELYGKLPAGEQPDSGKIRSPNSWIRLVSEGWRTSARKAADLLASTGRATQADAVRDRLDGLTDEFLSEPDLGSLLQREEQAATHVRVILSPLLDEMSASTEEKKRADPGQSAGASPSTAKGEAPAETPGGQVSPDTHDGHTLFSAAAASRYIGVHASTVTRWIREHKISIYGEDGVKYWFSIEELNTKRDAQAKK